MPGIAEYPGAIEDNASVTGGAVPSGPSDTLDRTDGISAYDTPLGGTPPTIPEYQGAGAVENSAGDVGHCTANMPVDSGSVSNIPASPYSPIAEEGTETASRASGSVAGGHTPITPDSVNTIPESPYSSDSAGQAPSVSTSSTPSSSPVSTGSAVTPDVTHSIPTFENVEIGGGRITGREITLQSPKGREFAMYNTEQYSAPQGDYDIVKTVDNAKWYKQYAVSAVEKTPKMGKGGKIEYDEKIVQVMPPVPKRKDRI